MLLVRFDIASQLTILNACAFGSTDQHKNLRVSKFITMEQWTTVEELTVNHLIRRFRCFEPQGGVRAGTQGIAALSGTIAQAFHQQLLQIGLPFRVYIRGVVQATSDSHGTTSEIGFKLPPVSINPLQVHGMNTWDDFLHIVREQFELYAEEMHDMPSGVVFDGIEKLEVTYVPQDNLAAFRQHLEPLGGGAKHELPEDLVAKKCVLNIQNDDDQCLRCCLISWKLNIYKDPDNAKRWGKYLSNMPGGGRKPKGWKPEYIDCGLNLTSLPLDRCSRFEDLEQVELLNPGLGIYVYFWHEATVNGISQSMQIVARQPQDPFKVQEGVFLLLYKGHWCLITRFQAFMSKRSFEVSPYAGSRHGSTHTCHRCLLNFGGQISLDKHLKSCKGNWEEPTKLPRLPSTKNVSKKGDLMDKVSVEFENWHHTFMHELIVYADIETFFTGLNDTKEYGENRHIASIGMHAVGRQGLLVPEEFQAQIFLNDGFDPFFAFMSKLLRLCVYWRFCKKKQERLVMRPQDTEVFEKAAFCAHCGIPFADRGVVKCKDHNHYTGEFRGALCSPCNAKACTPKELRVFTHNGTGYDHHFYMLGLSRLQSSGIDMRTFIGAPAEWLIEGPEQYAITLESFKINVLAESSEKIRCIQFAFGDIQITFMDSRKFLKESLEKLIASHLKASKQDLTSGFPIMAMHHPRICEFSGCATRCLERLNLLLKKIPYPYSSMRDRSFWTAAVPTDKQAYYDDLRQKEIADKDHKELLEIIEILGITTGRELHDVYLHTDVLALADVCESFREKFFATTGLDPFHKLGLPGAAWDNLLKNSGVLIENITEECCKGGGAQLMRYVDANIRGGLSCAFVGHSKANNPNCPDYVPCDPKEHVWIKDFDANSLYPYCMSMPLPQGNYCLLGGTDHAPEGYDPTENREISMRFLQEVLDTYTPDSDRGYMLIVRAEIPEELHDYWDFAPAVNRTVQWSELSSRQQQVKRRKHLQGFNNPEARARKLASVMRAPGHQKLVPDLAPQDRKAIHVEHAQLLRKHGVVFTELYAAYSFDQACIFKDVMEKHASRRAASTDEAVRDLEKLCMNSPYGKTLENKRDRSNFKVHTNVDSFRRNACFKRTHEFRVQHYCEDDGSFLGITSARGTKQIVLDTPRIVGWAILEYAKMVMVRFHYDVMKPLFPDALKLLYTDTDSMYYEIRSAGDPIDIIAERNKELQVFDLSHVCRYKDTPLKNKLGCFKYEAAGNKDGIPGEDNEIVEAVFLAPKSYAKRMAKQKKGSDMEIKGKGVPGAVLKELFGTVDYFKDALLKNVVSLATFRKFCGKDHIVKHSEITKVALSAENDKVFQLSPYLSRPLGHYKNCDPLPPCNEWDLTDSEDDAVPQAVKLLAKGLVPPPAVTADVEEELVAAEDSEKDVSDMD